MYVFDFLVPLVADNVKLLQKSSEFKSGHSIETVFAAPRIVCEIDGNRMKQVFWNLATNALKAMRDGGALRISVAPAGDGRVEVCFADEGIGMGQRERELYFQPFSSSFHQGTGLGAAIVYRLVEEHGGRIELESEAGQGTRVSITLPRRCRDAVSAPESQLELQAAGGQLC